MPAPAWRGRNLGQPQQKVLDLFPASLVEFAVPADDDKAALLQHPDRGHIARSHTGVEGTRRGLPEQLGKSRGGETPAPEGFSQPVADHALALSIEADDVAGDCSFEEDRLLDDVIAVEDAQPALRERRSGPARHPGVTADLGVGLLLEEDRD